MPLHSRWNSFTWSFHGWLQLFLRKATLYLSDIKTENWFSCLNLEEELPPSIKIMKTNEIVWWTLWSRVGSWELLSSSGSSVKRTTLLHAQFLVHFSCRPVSQSSPSCWLIVACRYLGLSVDISCSHYPEAHLSISTVALFHS